jgi:hypothetical protein
MTKFKLSLFTAFGFALVLNTKETKAGSAKWNSKTLHAIEKTIAEEPASKVKKKKNNTRLNNKVVKIYPDIIKREMHVVAKENNGKVVDFFVFSTEGTIVQQYKMSEREHKKITGLAPGKYIYRVFTGDTETAFGNFEIR